MNFSTSWVGKHFQDKRGAADLEIPIYSVFTNAEQGQEKGLFVPLDKQSGKEQLELAMNKGAIAVLWWKELELPPFLPTDFPVFFVEDTTIALKQLAHEYRLKVDPTVIGVTGSVGKSITTHLIQSIVSSKYDVHSSEDCTNTEVDIPLTILNMDPSTEVLVLSLAMHYFGDLKELTSIAEPNYAMITDIGDAHIDLVGSREGISQAKAEILAGLKEDGLLLIDGDEPLLAPLHTLDHIISVGFNEKNHYVIQNISHNETYSKFTLNTDDLFQVESSGEDIMKCASFAVLISTQLGIEINSIQELLSNIILEKA